MAKFKKIKVQTIRLQIEDGKVTEDEEHSYEKQLCSCDLCGATTESDRKCCRCHKDLCKEHRIEIIGSPVLEVKGVLISLDHIFCRYCLIEEFKKL